MSISTFLTQHHVQPLEQTEYTSVNGISSSPRAARPLQLCLGWIRHVEVSGWTVDRLR